MSQVSRIFRVEALALVMSLAAVGAFGQYEALDDFSSIDDWRVEGPSMEWTNVGMDVLTIRTITGAAAVTAHVEGLDIDLGAYRRLQIRMKRDATNTAEVKVSMAVRQADRQTYWLPMGSSGMAVANDEWQTFTFDVPESTEPFVIENASVTVSTGEGHPACGVMIDFIVLSAADAATLEDEPEGLVTGEANECGPPYLHLYPSYLAVHYGGLYEEAQAFLEGMKPEWSAQLREEAALGEGGMIYHVKIGRDVSAMHFSRQNGMIDAVDIRKWRLEKDCAVSNLVVTSAEGVTYEQKYATDGELNQREEDRFFFLTGTFTPTSAAGEEGPWRFSVEHKYYRSSGLLVSRYRPVATGEEKVVYLAIENSLGATPRELDCIAVRDHRAGRQDTNIFASRDSEKVAEERAKFKDVRAGANIRFEFVDLGERQGEEVLLDAARAEFVTLTDGYLGLHVMPLSWKHSSIALEYWKEVEKLTHRKFMTAIVDERGYRYANTTYINQPATAAVKVGEDAVYGQSVSLLPWRELTIQPGFHATMNCVPNTFYPPEPPAQGGDPTFAPKPEWAEETEIEMQALAEEGVRIAVHTLNPYGRQCPERFFKRFLELAHHLGMEDITYTGDMLNLPDREPNGRIYSKEEREALRKEVAVDIRTFAHDLPSEEATLNWTCKHHPITRQYWIANNYLLLEKLEAGGVMFDLTYHLPCANTAHGCDIEGRYPVEENMDLREALRLILDTRPNRYMLNHSWNDVLAADDILADFTLPAEHITGMNRKQLSYMEECLSWNSLVYGVTAVLYDANAYDYGDSVDEPSPVIDQALRRCVIPSLVHSVYYQQDDKFPVHAAGIHTETERAIMHKYFDPQIVFNTKGSTLHHPGDADYGEFVQVEGDEDVQVLVFEREEGALIVATNVRRNEAAAKVRVDAGALGMETAEMFVLDPFGMEAATVKAEEGRLSWQWDLTNGPVIKFLRSQPQVPTIVWHDVKLHAVESQNFNVEYYTGLKMLTAQLKGVPNAEATVYAHLAGFPAPDKVEGATIASTDGDLLTLAVLLDNTGRATVRFATGT